MNHTLMSTELDSIKSIAALTDVDNELRQVLSARFVQVTDPVWLARIDRWATALESGCYDQTRDALRDHEGFCCLGVACDIFDVGLWEKSYKDDYLYMDKTGSLPGKVGSWYGINPNKKSSTTHAVVRVPGLEGFYYLSDLNDMGCTFTLIALLIRYTYGVNVESSPIYHQLNVTA